RRSGPNTGAGPGPNVRQERHREPTGPPPPGPLSLWRSAREPSATWREFPCRRSSGRKTCLEPLPDGDTQFQLGAETLLNLAANELNEAEDVAGARAGMGDNVAGVPLAHLRAADARLG